MEKFVLLNAEERAFLVKAMIEEREKEVHYHTIPRYETEENVMSYQKRLEYCRKNNVSVEDDIELMCLTRVCRHLIDFWKVYFEEGKDAAFKWQRKIDEANKKKSEESIKKIRDAVAENFLRG